MAEKAWQQASGAELRDHTFGHIQEAGRANWKQGETVTVGVYPRNVLPPARPQLLTVL